MMQETSVSNIYAAGDCTSFEYKDTLVRLESVGNAIDQANIVAQNIMKQKPLGIFLSGGTQ